MYKQRKIISRRDLILVLALLLAAAAFGLAWRAMSPEEAGVCQISLDDATVMELPLDRDAVFSLPELPQVVFEVKNGKAGFKSSDCRDQVCVRTGYLGQPGQFAACLPNNLALKISGENPVDTVAW